MTVRIPPPGRRRASRRASSTGSPKCMKRPPLHVPTAMCSSSAMPQSSLGRNRIDAGVKSRARAADASVVGRVLTPFVAIIVLLAVTAPVAAAADETHIIVARDPGLSAGERADIRDDAGVDLVQTLRIPDTEVVSTDDPSSALASLRSDPDVRYAEIDRVRHAFRTNDFDFDYLWALENTGQSVEGVTGTPDADMDVPEAWSAAPGAGMGITVAVVDTGVQANHPDLSGQITSGRSFVGSAGAASSYADDNGHGTHVTGTIAALGNNSAGIVGIAPGARIMSLKALDAGGGGSDSDIAEAFDWAGDHNIR